MATYTEHRKPWLDESADTFRHGFSLGMDMNCMPLSRDANGGVRLMRLRHLC